jgi:iron complex transport system ATP-binding protein
MANELYIAKGLEFAYRPGAPVLSDVDFTVRRGEFVALIGPNGSGKSTLLKLLVGLIRPQKGTIEFDGRTLSQFPPRSLARRVAYLPQEDEIHFPFTVGEVVMLGRWPHSGGAFFDSKSDREAAARAMDRVGIAEWSARPITELSGGERARVMLAKAVATEPECLLLDEPVSELDLKYCAEAYSMLHELVRSGLGVVVIAHDIGPVARWADRLVLLSNGRIVADGGPDRVLDSARLRDAYGIDVKVISDGPDRAIFAVKGGDTTR